MRITTLAALLLMAGPAVARAQEVGAYRSDALPDRREAPEYYDDQDDYGYRDRDGYAQQRGLGVHVYLENERDLFRPGELARVLVRPTQDAYVAVVHITPDGDVEFLWPNDYGDDGYMRGGMQYSVSSRGGVRGLRIGSGYGIGYVMAVASDEPLDLRRARDYYYRRSASWDPGLNVVGDPFRAMERIARMLVPDYDDGYGAVDWYTYHVGSQRYRYPRYACYDSYGPWYTSRSSYYDGCDRVRVLLVDVPYYYDTRYYHGDRWRYYRRWYATDTYYNRRRYAGDYGRRDPQHGYKERTYGYDRATGAPNRRPFVRSADAPPSRSGSAGSRSSGSDQEGGGGSVTRPSTRQRPTLERRPAETEPVRVTGQREPRSEPRERSVEPRSEPRAEPRERSAEPREPRYEPRRESPRVEQPRREPPQQRAEPRSEPRSAPSSGDGGSSGRSAPRERPRAVAPQG
ncbi:MAG: DUF4384 domain-containing protein [Longimicrobiaceae bacterium]